jgi:hypothetical protein
MSKRDPSHDWMWLVLLLLAVATPLAAQSPGRLIRPGDFPSGLQGWWKMEENTGSERQDSSGNGNHLSPITTRPAQQAKAPCPEPGPRCGQAGRLS